MATPESRSNSNGALSTGPSRTLLEQLLEEVNGVTSSRAGLTGSSPQSPASTYSRSSSQSYSPSVWVGGSPIAQNARNELRRADEALGRKASVNAIDGAPDGMRSFSKFQRTPDPVSYPHEYMQYMLKGSPLSPEIQGRNNHSLHLKTPPLGNATPPPLSPLIFSDVYFDDSSSLSPQTETTVSPTDVPTSAATAYTAEELRTPTGDDALKRSHYVDDSLTDASAQKRRTMTVPEIRSEGYFDIAVDIPHGFIGVGGDNRCLLRHETFTERAPTPRMLTEMSMSDVQPGLSSFRPTAADPQGRPSLGPLSQRVSRAFTSPPEPTSPALPDTPAWMRPMHLVDHGGRSVYTNIHDDGPIRHALCLWCFRTHGSFRKVHKYGCETCGRKEVLDSHYWEDDKWPEDSSDESNCSDH
ncbi:uncharacterized protein M421DRAFT_227482 [Didymella exigua CBS 183.55]|uniref:Uncharacterized protein n=1 Tax=Didymella exigua CBS 183.55 TaxID=1150837 RepID=A0A6A5RHI3_9PLEO|nr:uncharacterized protein M421DRAFT_227482 [Didymella exigua CBS 183.55]KAF1925916.1 hypothetical protein M421DRAFT_227482 [Didymella exigua CBS 183.55]